MKKPSLCGFHVHHDGKAHVAIEGNANFKKMPLNERIVFMNSMGRLLMQMILKAQAEQKQ